MISRAASIRRSLPRFIAPFGGLLLGLALVQAALAHAMPDQLSPADGAVVTTRPTEVAIDTGEMMSTKPADNDLIVRDASGTAVTTVHAKVDATQMHLSLPLPTTLSVGTYKVTWSTVSADDGHDATGTWTFTYDPSKPANAGTQPAAGVDTAGIKAVVSFAQPGAGASISGANAPLVLRTDKITLVPVGAGQDVPDGTLGGHFHIMVDGKELGMIASTSGFTVGNLSNGAHMIMAQFVAPNHVPYDPPIQATVQVTVSGSAASGSPQLIAQAAGSPAPAKTGNAGLALSTGTSVAQAVVLVLVSMLLVTGARVGTGKD